ncbi:MAG TPA: AmmeMemoRadiSam system protein B [Candidatus Limnocylindrales bacterium]|nr:AmmeMemoRadiSam system protein B [Candidatus Limnocylindrales bacterium]
MIMHGAVRPPTHAGNFYPRDPVALRRLLADLRARAAAPLPVDGELVGLLVPHAGLAYSGTVATAAWDLLGGPTSRPVVLAGTNHWVPGYESIGVWPDGAWACPLGEVPVDARLARAILRLGGPFRPDTDVHREEHSLEVQLPFLVGPGRSFVPLLVGLHERGALADAGERLAGVLLALRQLEPERPAPIIVATSDLAHYPDDATARVVDAAILEPIAALDAAELGRREREYRRGTVPGVACGVCGLEPILLAIATVRALGATRGLVLGTATSADAGAGAERVVGYAAVAFVA